MATSTTPEPLAKAEPLAEAEPLTRLQRQKYLEKHFPQTQRQLREHVSNVLKSWKTMDPCPTDQLLWEAFQTHFMLWSPNDFKNLGTDSQELQRYLRCGGVFVATNTKHTTIAQALYKTANEPEQYTWTHNDIAACKEDLKKGPITSFWIRNTPIPYDVRLPLLFASFAQEAIPLYLQYKELPEERVVRLTQENIRRERKAQARQEQEQQREQRQEQHFLKKFFEKEERRQQRFKALYRPQPSNCRHYNKHFKSKNALFRHLEQHKTSRLRASSVASRSSASSISSASSVSSASSTSSTSSTTSIASIEQIQLRILKQLQVLRSTSPPRKTSSASSTSSSLRTLPTPPSPSTTPSTKLLLRIRQLLYRRALELPELAPYCYVNKAPSANTSTSISQSPRAA